MPLQPNSSVRQQFSADGVVLLDLKADRIYSLDPIGAEMWKCLTQGGGIAAAAEYLHASWSVDENQAKKDAADFASSLRAKGLLVDAVQTVPVIRPIRSAPQSKSDRWLVANACMGLAQAEWHRVRGGLAALHAFVANTPVAASLQPDALTKVQRAFDRAAMFYPNAVLCLGRSAAMAVMLRERGVAADLVIGVRRHPFRAHAWLEVDGVVANDRQGVQRDFEVLERVGGRQP